MMRRDTTTLLNGDIMNVSAVAFNEQFTETHTAHQPFWQRDEHRWLSIVYVRVWENLSKNESEMKMDNGDALAHEKKCQNDFNWSEHTFNDDDNLPQYIHLTGQFYRCNEDAQLNIKPIQSIVLRRTDKTRRLFFLFAMRENETQLSVIQMCEKLLESLLFNFIHMNNF